MPEMQAFRGLRYDLGHVGSLSDVVAPPYDVIGPELQDALYKRHPANVIRLELNRDEPGDDQHNNRYTRAARFLRNWRSEGVLFSEAQPAVYVYHQVFEIDGQTFCRRGFMARCRLERFGEGKIFPHEETMSGPKQDRLLLTRACRTNLSQIFGLFPDPAAEAQTMVERAVHDKIPVEAVDHLGVVHRLWPVTDLGIVSPLAGLVGNKPLFIADGHHRYETACNYRDELVAAHGPLPSGHPANFVLMMFIGMSDPGLLVLPTHRLFRGLPALSSEELIRKLGDSFSTRLAGEGSDLAENVWEDIETSGDQGTLGFFTPQDERWIVAKITSQGRARMAQMAQEHSPAWQGLGVSILHRLVMDTLLGAKDLPKPRYVHTVREVIDGLDGVGLDSVDGGKGLDPAQAADRFQLAALVMPASVDHIRTISEHGERMPAKSTYFYPKLLSGLVMNPLE